MTDVLDDLRRMAELLDTRHRGRRQVLVVDESMPEALRGLAAEFLSADVVVYRGARRSEPLALPPGFGVVFFDEAGDIGPLVREIFPETKRQRRQRAPSQRCPRCGRQSIGRCRCRA